MANIQILSDPPTDTGVYSLGSWSLPLDNLKNKQPTKVARSTNALAASTKFAVALSRLLPINIFAFIAHNFTPTATIRVRVATNAAGTTGVTLDQTITAADTTVVWGSEPWGVFPWSGFDDGDWPGGPNTFLWASGSVYGTYVVVDITDTANPDGYVQIGRFMAGQAFSPAANMSVGSPNFGYIDDSTHSRSYGGQLHSNPRPLRRRFSCAFDFLSEAEAMGAASDLMRRQGTSGNLLVIFDPAEDSSVLVRRAIYGRLTDLDDVVVANATDSPYSWRLTVEERL